MRITLLIVICFSTACNPFRAFQGLNENLEGAKNQRPIYRLKQGDVVDIKILADDPENTKVFHQGFKDSKQFQYIISQSGEVKLPVLGAIDAENLSLKELETRIQKSVDEYIVNSQVSVDLTYIDFSVIGKVNTPGRYFSEVKTVSIFDAISMAGGIRPFARVKKIRILRKETDHISFIDLTIRDESIFQSEAYFISPHDVIILE